MCRVLEADELGKMFEGECKWPTLMISINERGVVMQVGSAKLNETKVEPQRFDDITQRFNVLLVRAAKLYSRTADVRERFYNEGHSGSEMVKADAKAPLGVLDKLESAAESLSDAFLLIEGELAKLERL
jgi:hypothetical protein